MLCVRPSVPPGPPSPPGPPIYPQGCSSSHCSVPLHPEGCQAVAGVAGGHGVALLYCPQAVPKPDGCVSPPPAASPTLHPVQSPQTRFCVLTVAPDTLPAIATMLIDVLFYSHRWVPGTGTRLWPLARCHLNHSAMFYTPPPPISPSGISSSGCVLQTGFALSSVPGGCSHMGAMGATATMGCGSPEVTWGPSPHCSKAQGGGKQKWVGCKRPVGTALGCGDAPGQDIPCPLG